MHILHDLWGFTLLCEILGPNGQLAEERKAFFYIQVHWTYDAL